MSPETTEGVRACGTNSLVKLRRLRDLNPGWAINPNRISRSLPLVRAGRAPVTHALFAQVNRIPSFGLGWARPTATVPFGAIGVPSARASAAPDVRAPRSGRVALAVR